MKDVVTCRRNTQLAVEHFPPQSFIILSSGWPGRRPNNYKYILIDLFASVLNKSILPLSFQGGEQDRPDPISREHQPPSSEHAP